MRMMRVTFVDESGRAGDTMFVDMAACDARWPVWQEFDRRWRAALLNNNAPYLHMKEFAGSRGPYAGWSEDQRRSLLGDCLRTLDALVIDMFASVLRSDDFYALPAEEQAAL